MSTNHIGMITSTIAKTTTRKFDLSTFRHPKLTNEQHSNGCKLGIDTWADTNCAGRHAFVEEFVIGKTVTATGFTSSLGSVPDLPVVNVLYAYDTNDGTVILLEVNNAIYLGDRMSNSLMNPIQAEEIGVRVDVRPKRYYPHDIGCQCLTFSDGTIIPVLYEGVLPYVPVRRPTKEEIHHCRRLELSSRAPWDPFLLDGHFSAFINGYEPDMAQLYDDVESYDAVASELMSTQLSTILSMRSMVEYDEVSDRYCSISALNSTRCDSISPEELSRRLCIGLKTAARTLKATSHQYIRTTGLLSKRFRTDKSQLRYKQLSKQYGTFYADFLKVAAKSIRGYIGGVLYTNKVGFKKFFPCESEKGQETGRSLRSFIEVVGLPYSLHSDNHSNFKEGFFKKMLRKFGIYQTFTEPHSPWQNRAEPAIGEVKAYSRRLMQKTNTPVRLWCFCYEYSADVLSLLATGRFDLQGRTSYEVVMHYTPDISEYVSYTWFQWCHYYDEATKSKRLCRWLGPAHQVGQAFCSYILLDNAEYIARSTVVGIDQHELTTEAMKSETSKFMVSVESVIGNHRVPIFNHVQPNAIYFDAFSDDHDSDANVLPYGDELIDVKTETVDEAYLESLDEYIGSQIVIPNKEAIPVLATVKKRKRDALGKPIGTSNENPILDSRIYELEFPDGRIEEYSVNVIAENLLNMADDDGWDTGLLDDIIDFRKDDSIAVTKENGFTEISNGDQVPVITTKGWDVQVRWKDKSTNWIPLSEIKESNPVEVAEAAIAFKFDKEPAFNWWVRKVLKRRDRMISKMKTRRCRKGRMKFGVQIPGTVEEAIALDIENGNTLWQDAIKLEMTNSRVAFKLREKGEKAPVGYTQITCHLIFDLKLNMTRKARYVAGGHLTDVPTYMTYSSVVSRDTVRIGFLMAALNDLSILAGDIQNAFLEAPTKEKIYFYAGEEWKADQGKIVIVVRALYGLKSSALQFRNCLAEVLGNRLGFKSSLADPDLWYKPMTDKNGFEYYAYILVYVDDLLIIMKEPQEAMTQIQESFTVKPPSIEEPKSYLGADVDKVYYQDGSYGWTMGAETYTTQAIKNRKKRMQKEGFEYNKKLSDVNYSPQQPFSTLNYRPEVDVSDECSSSQTQFFQNLIGILRWTVELDRIDIAYKVSVLSCFLSQPRTGHLVQALHIFKYLDLHKSNELAFDPAYHDVEDSQLV